MTYNRIFLGKSHFLWATGLFFLSLAACEDEPGCVSDTTNVVKVGFFKIDDTTKRNADKVAISGISFVGRGFFPLDSSFDGLQLPLNPSEDVTTFEATLASGEVKTLTLRYRREQALISPECGPTQRYYDLQVDTTNTTFDSIRVLESELSELSTMDIQVYTCQDSFYTQEVRINLLQKDTAGVRRDSLFVRSLRDDRGQVLAENDTLVGSLRVPVNPQATSSTLIFDLLPHNGQPARIETLQFSYQNEQVRFARKCRLQTRYFRLDTLRSTFDSLHISNRELAVDIPLNIELIDKLE